MKENVCWAIAGCVFLLTGLSAGDLLFAGQEGGVLPMPSLKERETPQRKAQPPTEPVDDSALHSVLHPGLDPKAPPVEGGEAPAELLLRDPQGRRIGDDPVKGVTYNEIPEAYYEKHFLADDETGHPGPQTIELDVPRPEAGEYQLQVIGTGTGTYDLEIRAYDPKLNPSIKYFENLAIAPGVVHSYGFFFAKTVGAELEVFGGFDGGGQRPREVRKFLSYINPSKQQTTLPAGARRFELMLVYGKAIRPTTFTATLNGENITALFTPTPGTEQTVYLCLRRGRNVLVLSVEGNLPNRVATDTDRLVFVVP